MKGTLVVGYKMFNERYYAKVYKDVAVIGDFACMHNKVSEFFYEPTTTVSGFAVKKENFMKLLNHKIGKEMKPRIERNYRRLREVINANRDMESRK